MTAPSVLVTGVLLLALAAAGFVLTFLVAQRSTGRAPPEVEETLHHAQVVDGLAEDLKRLRRNVVEAGATREALAEIDESIASIEETGSSLRRAAERVI